MTANRPLIRSTLSHDPDFADLVQEFVNDIPAKIEAIRNFRATGDITQLQRAIHQLRGACGGYGFQCLTVSAAEIEEKMKSGMSIDQLDQKLSEFADDLSRMSAEA